MRSGCRTGTGVDASHRESSRLFPRYAVLWTAGDAARQVGTVPGVVAPDHVLFGPATRVFWLKVVVAAGLVAGLLLSMPLWAGPRLFPFAPPFPAIPAGPAFIDTVAFAALIAVLAVIAVARRPAKPIQVALALALVLALRDQMRWQPWFYQYCFMLAALGLWSGTDDRDDAPVVLNTCRLIVASVYLYAGLQKLNPEFTGYVLPWMLEPFASVVPPSLRTVPRQLGMVVPLFEIAIGLGLTTTRLRRYAVALALVMLVFVLVTLGPWGRNWNSVVWPWNAAMALFVVILFWRTDDVSFREILWVRQSVFQKVVLVLFAILPAFSFVNLWDSYASSTLYSGNTNRARLFIPEAVRVSLPTPVQQYALRLKDSDQNELDFHMWAVRELGVPPYPEARVFKAITRSICGYAGAGPDVFVVIRGKPTLFNRDVQSVFNCLDLGVQESGSARP